MMLLLTFLSTLLPLYLAQGPTATATFGSGTDDAIGWVTVQDGEVSVYLNLTYGKMNNVFDDACLQGGFTYHIHTQWNNAVGTWGTFGDCSAGNTAYHYDPLAACGGNTDNALCDDTQTGGCIAPGLGSGTYSCSESTFDMNPLYCEVGDWSGKYGRLYADDDTNVTFSGSWSSFFEIDASLLQNQSVVFHCDGDRAICAVFDVSGSGTDSKPEQEDMKTVMVDFSDAIEDYDSGYDSSTTNAVSAMSDGSWSVDLTFSSTAQNSLLADYAAVCASGLNMYIFSEWNSAMDSLWGNNNCSTATGMYTWDPTNQCLPMSNSSYCGGTSDDVICPGNNNNVTYNCDRTVDYSCAPGDLSRWSDITINQLASGSVSASGTDDEMPNLDNIVGASVGVLCGTTFLMCGRIQDRSQAVATATFNGMYTNVTGTVNVSNQQITMELDLSNQDLPDGCASDSGLSWHIHYKWDHTDNYARHGSTMCGSGYTGGHYDPYNACAGATNNVWCNTNSNSASACAAEGTVMPSSSFNPNVNTYTCDETYFNEYPYSCEVGDWSGKYGKVTLDNNMISATFNNQYAEVRATDLVDRAIVFHCGDDASRIFCAPFILSGTDGNDVPAMNSSEESDYYLVAYLQDITGSGDMSTNYIKIYDNGYYQVAINTNGVTNACSTATMYRLSLYSGWTGTEQTTSDCSNLYTTFYDPGYTCPPQVNNTYCDCILNNNGYNYTCDYDTDKFTCAVGDLTGKYGNIYPDDMFYAVGYDLTLPSLMDLDDLAVVLECDETGYEAIGCTGFSSMSNDPTMYPSMNPYMDPTMTPYMDPTASPIDDTNNNNNGTDDSKANTFKFNNILYTFIITLVVSYCVY